MGNHQTNFVKVPVKDTPQQILHNDLRNAMQNTTSIRSIFINITGDLVAGILLDRFILLDLVALALRTNKAIVGLEFFNQSEICNIKKYIETGFFTKYFSNGYDWISDLEFCDSLWSDFQLKPDQYRTALNILLEQKLVILTTVDFPEWDIGNNIFLRLDWDVVEKLLKIAIFGEEEEEEEEEKEEEEEDNRIYTTRGGIQ